MAYYQPTAQEQTVEEEPTLSNVSPYVPGQTVSSPDYTPPTTYDPGTTGTVAGQLTGILAKESPYIQSARASGKENANSRGLLNSSIAAGASQKAAIDAAMPIAQQDASTYSAAGLQTQKFGESAALTDIQAGASSQLSTQEAQQAAALDSQQQAGANYRQDKEIALKQQLSLADVSLSEKNAMASHMATLGDNFQAKVAGIQVDENMTASSKTAAIATLQKVYESNLQSLGSMYGVQISWGTPPTTGSGSTTGPGSTPGTTDQPEGGTITQAEYDRIISEGGETKQILLDGVASGFFKRV